LQAYWDGTLIYAQTNITTATWTQLQFNVTASNSVTPLEFSFEDDPGYLALDDVSVFPQTGGNLTIGSTAAVARFSVKAATGLEITWNTSSGQNYQLQYTTNLFQPDWINVGSPVTASAATLTLTDTNNVPASPQRYYKLSVAQ
jgi:hypothetical protein